VTVKTGVEVQYIQLHSFLTGALNEICGLLPGPATLPGVWTELEARLALEFVWMLQR